MRTAKSTSSGTHPEDSSFLSLLTGLVQQPVQSFFVTQRSLLDLAIRRNASITRSVRKRLSDPRHSPTAFLAEVAGEGMTRFFEAQKVLLELGLKQNEILMNGVKERIGERPTAHAFADLLRRSVETFIHMQHQFLKIAGKQTHTWMEGAKIGKPYQSELLIQLVVEVMENFVKAQMQLMDIIADEIAEVTGGKRAHGFKKIKKTELSALFRQAAESFIDAQRKLVDLAGQQLTANVKTAGKALAALKPFPLQPLEELTQEAVKSYIDAEEALVDVIVKPASERKRVAKNKRRAKRQARVQVEKVAAVAA